MAGFRRGHVKVVKLMVRHVTQFPSDQEINRFMALVNEKDMTKKCLQCMEIIHQAKERQAAEANKHASILLQEIDQERSREETRKAAAARRREKKRQKKKEKQEQMRAKSGDLKENIGSTQHKKDSVNNTNKNKQQKNSSNGTQIQENNNNESSSDESSSSSDNDDQDSFIDDGESLDLLEIINRDMLLAGNLNNKRPLAYSKQQVQQVQQSQQATKLSIQSKLQARSSQPQQNISRQQPQSSSATVTTTSTSTPTPTSTSIATSIATPTSTSSATSTAVKEIVRKSKKVIVPASAISRVIGRGGCNINTVREVSCAHIEVEKQKGQADRGVIIKGTAEATRIAQQMIYALINESNKDLNEVIKKLGLQRPILNASNIPSKYMSTSSSISSSSSSKSTYTNSSLHTSIISSVGVWNNSTAANMSNRKKTSVRAQPPRTSVRSPAVASSYNVPCSIATTSYLSTSAINDRTINTFLQHPSPAHNQTSPQSQIKTPSEASIAAIAQQIAAVGQRQQQQSQFDPLTNALGAAVTEALVPGLTESLINANDINETLKEQSDEH
ncbi:hypothetical protein SUGI_1493080 [Cryptomeria japonica]|uniref:K Homology domain-containing protein n=1 Tax=Cryptomeria japonica TaxID=3369 RepID=A0AAD3RRE6_CRYJA|nr:hypothetical protein SUGI_1493080 [Cryptomeria japonica]